MNKRRRDRLEERREASRIASASPAPARTPVSRARPLADKVSRPINRSPFMAAKARRDLVNALPDVVYQRPEPRRAARKAAAAPLASTPAKLAQRAPAARKPAPDRKLADRPLTIDLPETCKARPDGRKAGGKGAGRSFVPWCR